MKESHYTPNVGNVPVSGGTVTIPASQIPQGNTYELVLTADAAPGCAWTVGDIARVRVLAGNVAFIDVSLAHLQAWFARFAPNHAPILATGKVLPIPMQIMDEKGQKRRRVCQVPPNMPISIQILFGAFVAGVAETVNLLTLQDPAVEPQYSPILISNSMQIAAAAVNRIYDPKMEGFLRGVGINTTGLTGMSLTVAGRQIYDQVRGDALVGEDMIHQTAPGVTGQAVDPIMTKEPWLPMNEGNAIVKLTTAGGWAGVANELCLYLLQPEGKQLAAGAVVAEA